MESHCMISPSNTRPPPGPRLGARPKVSGRRRPRARSGPGFRLGAVLLWLPSALVFWASISSSLAQNPNLPPGGNFDLGKWKLTLPDATASEIGPVQLEGGFTNQF